VTKLGSDSNSQGASLPIGADERATYAGGRSPRVARSFSLLDALLLDGFEHRHDRRTVEQLCADADAREAAELLGEDESE
jgi:hypothetical protein